MDYRNLKKNILKKNLGNILLKFKRIESDDFEQRESTENCKYPTYERHDISSTENKKIYHGSYGLENYIVTIDDLYFDDKYHKYLWKILNMFNVIVKKATKMITFKEMELLADNLMESDRQISWVWFRDKGYKLTNKIMVRAASWIELNPEFKCNLWTDLANVEELEDFISELNEKYQKYFRDRITVKYMDDTKAVFNEFYEKNKEQLDSRIIAMWDDLFNNRFKISRLFKTDGFRSIMLNVVGGIYCDFNDTVCFFPMKYLLPLFREQYFFGSDMGPKAIAHRNNYFMYCPLGNTDYLDITLEILKTSVEEYYRITSVEFVQSFMNIIMELIQNIDYEKNYLLESFSELEGVKFILTDKNKDILRLATIIIQMMRYFEKFTGLANRMETELGLINKSVFKMQKKVCSRRGKFLEPLEKYDINFTANDFVIDETFMNRFLMDYAGNFINGDLLCYTNIAFIREITSLVPFSKSDKLSDISMMMHLYDSTSYGSVKNYGDGEGVF